MNSFKLQCTECSVGHYTHVTGGLFRCENCDKQVTHRDIEPNLEDGEFLAKDHESHLIVASF